ASLARVCSLSFDLSRVQRILHSFPTRRSSDLEYYLPDVIEIMRQKSEKVSAFLTPDFDETIGINDRVALARAEKVMRKRINEYHMRNGVTIVDPDHTYIESDVTIGQDAVIYPGSFIKGDTVIESGAEIGPHTEIDHCTVGAGTQIRHSVVKDS